MWGTDDVLHFKDRNQRVKMLVKYEDYKQFKSQTSITFGDTLDDKKPSEKSEPKK